MDNKTLSIIHRPFGNGQPYFQQPFERFPRMPRVGEPIMVGAETVLTHAAETMHVQYRLESEPKTHLVDATCIGESDCIGNDPGQRWWMAALPAVTVATTVYYRFKACTGNDAVYSPWYACPVGKTFKSGRITTWTSYGNDGVVIRCEDLSIQFADNNGTLSITISKENQQYVHYASGFVWQISELEDSLELKGSCTVIIDKNNMTWRIDKDGTTCFSMTKPVEISETFDETGRAFAYVTISARAPAGERYVGFGERYNALDQRGNIILNRVFEQYKDQKLKTYVPMPFFITNRNWGLHVHTERLVEFDMASRVSDQWSMCLETIVGETCRFDFLFGSPQAIRSAFIAHDPQCPPIPEWALGLWMSANDWNSQKLVEWMAEKTRETDIPATALVIEAWSDETTFYIFNDAEYEVKDTPFTLKDFHFKRDGLWPDPKGMVTRLLEQGIRTVLWQIPVLRSLDNREHRQHELDKTHAVEHKFVLGTADSGLYTSAPGWFKGSLIPDFTNCDTCEWWLAKRRYLLEEVGIAGFKTDGGEHLWGYGITASDGRTGDRLINAFPQLYLNAYHQELNRSLGIGKGILFSRAGYVGAGSTPAHWAGDQDSTWDAFRSMIKAMLNASACGIVWYSWDIGGFSGPIPTAELYLRSAAAATFSPIMQYHSEHHGRKTPSRDRTPWNIGEQTHDESVVPIFRKFAKIRMALVPYLARQGKVAIESAKPLVKPLWFEWPRDETAWKIWDEYMLGSDLLIAPIVEEGATSRDVYLPKGLWKALDGTQTIEGPCTIRREVPLESVAVFVRLDTDFDPLLTDEAFMALIRA